MEAALRQEFGAEASEIVWRRSDGRLQQDGWEGADAPVPEGGESSRAGGRLQPRSSKEAGAGDGWGGGGMETRLEGTGAGRGGGVDEGKDAGAETSSARDTDPITLVRELGLEYEVHPHLGQKTGKARKPRGISGSGACLGPARHRPGFRPSGLAPAQLGGRSERLGRANGLIGQ